MNGSLANAARALAALLILLAPSLAGCLGLGGGGPCSSVTLPAARAGEGYLYDAYGRFEMPSINYGFGDWRAVDPDGQQEPIELPEGSTLRVQVEASLEQHMDITSALRQTWPIEYFASKPEYQGELRFAKEWVDADEGYLVAESPTAALVIDGEVKHSTKYGRMHRPVAFGSSFLWDRALSEGQDMELTVPRPAAFGLDLSNETGTLHYRVERTRSVGNSCEVDVLFTWIVPEFPVASLTQRLTFDEVHGLPVAVKEVSGGAGSARKPLDLRLREFAPGQGPPLPAFDMPSPFDSPRWKSSAQTVPTQDGFLAGGEEVFPTSYQEAMAAIRGDGAASQWLAEHPGARPLYVTHAMGAPNSTVVDQWIIDWRDANGTTRSISVTRERPLVPIILEDELRVLVEYGDDFSEDEPVPLGDWVTVDYIAQLHRGFYGQEPEVLDCSLALGTCSIGTHASMNFGYADSGGFFPLAGLMVDVRRGWLVQEESDIAEVLD